MILKEKARKFIRLRFQNPWQLHRLQNTFQGRRCFILGNGSSLRQHNLKLLQNEIVFCVNWFVLHPEFKNLKGFYCLGDSRFYHTGEFAPELASPWAGHPGMSYFFDPKAYPAVRRREQSGQLSAVYFVSVRNEYKVWEGSFWDDPGKGLAWGWTTIIDMCLPLAFYMGFQTVYLLGCDCDYGFEKTKDFSASYFYNIQQLPEQDRAYLEKQRQNPQQFNQSGILERSYQTVKRYFEAAGRKIYNAGFGGKLEVFDRVNYDDLWQSSERWAGNL